VRGGLGTVFKLATGDTRALTTLVSFNGANGTPPLAGLIVDTNGNLFGTTSFGGTHDRGTVFEVTGSGFIVPVVVPQS
jgi:uncharacterized repeat protein (TIGR03803 family)